MRTELRRFMTVKRQKGPNGSNTVRKTDLTKTPSLIHGYPMDLLLTISVPQANFCWPGDMGKLICPWKEIVAGK